MFRGHSGFGINAHAVYDEHRDGGGREYAADVSDNGGRLFAGAEEDEWHSAQEDGHASGYGD